MRSAISLLAFMVTLLLASAAHAGELQFGVVEREDGVTLQVRGFEGEAPKKVITSRTGMLFFFDGSKAKTTRLRPVKRHRVAYAQVGQTGSRVALRIAQRERARGALGTFVTTHDVPGGIDIDIVDRQALPEVETGTASPIGVAEPEAVEEAPDDRGSALAALEASLGGEPARAKVENDASPTDDEEPPVEAVAAIAPELEPPAASTEPEPAPSASGSSSGLRSVLAVALLFAFGGGAMWWIKRRKGDAAAPVLDVVSRVGIGPKQSVVLINAGGRQLLIGATEKRIEVLTEIGTPTAELRVPSAIDRAREPFGAALHPALRVPVAPPSDPTAPAKVAAFKARLEQALGRELTGEHPLYAGTKPSGEHVPFGKSSLASAEHARVNESTPAHLRLLQNDPRWGNEEGVA